MVYTFKYILHYKIHLKKKKKHVKISSIHILYKLIITLNIFQLFLSMLLFVVFKICLFSFGNEKYAWPV